MPRPRSISNDEIVHAARECFLEHGSTCSTVLIADKLGISQAAIFKRFGSKEALIEAAMSAPSFEQYNRLLRKEPDERPIYDQVLEIVDAVYTNLKAALPTIASMMAGKAHANTMPKYPLILYKMLINWFNEAKKQGRIKGSVEVASSAILGSVQFHTFSGHFHEDAPEMNTEELARFVCKALEVEE